MCVKDVKLIKIGTLTIEAFERPDSNLVAMKYFCGMGGGSTITYIETEDRKIIVDTGDESIAEGVNVLATPGHTEHHAL
jgi:glyoxylase-like metal-dependent hydrolase (beta-lactamase superfamily II)